MPRVKKARGDIVPLDTGKETENAWIIATFLPVSLFSLRMTHSTSKGGKTLTVPTPYSVKMALIDACFRRFGPADANDVALRVFEVVRLRSVRVCPPEHCVVNNTFVKILDPSREATDGPFRNTIAYREFVFFDGSMEIALAAGEMDEKDMELIRELFGHVTSLGKRGSLLQFVSAAMHKGKLPLGYTVPRVVADLEEAATYGMTSALDDFGKALPGGNSGFDRVSTFGGLPVRLGEHRELTLTAVPYRRRSAGRNFTWYERVTNS